MEKDLAKLEAKISLQTKSGLSGTASTEEAKPDGISESKVRSVVILLVYGMSRFNTSVSRSSKKTKTVVVGDGLVPPVTDSQVLNGILLKLLSSIVEQNPGSNVIASPLCLYWCFTLVGEGLGPGKTLKELQTALGFGTAELIGPHLIKLILGLSESELVTLKIVSSIFTNKNVKIKPTFLELLKTKYASLAFKKWGLGSGGFLLFC